MADGGAERGTPTRQRCARRAAPPPHHPHLSLYSPSATHGPKSLRSATTIRRSPVVTHCGKATCGSSHPPNRWLLPQHAWRISQLGETVAQRPLEAANGNQRGQASRGRGAAGGGGRARPFTLLLRPIQVLWPPSLQDQKANSSSSSKSQQARGRRKRRRGRPRRDAGPLHWRQRGQRRSRSGICSCPSWLLSRCLLTA